MGGPLAIPCDQRGVVVVGQNCFQPLAHLRQRRGIAEGAHESSYSIGISNSRASYRDIHSSLVLVDQRRPNRERKTGYIQGCQRGSVFVPASHLTRIGLFGIRVATGRASLALALSTRSTRSIHEDSSAHANPAMNSPYRQFNTSVVQRFARRRHMLVKTVDKSAAQIDEECRRG
jgi:hypothetical protein